MCEALRELFREELEEEREIGQAKVIVQDNLKSGASKEVIIKKLQKFVHIDIDIVLILTDVNPVNLSTQSHSPMSIQRNVRCG